MKKETIKRHSCTPKEFEGRTEVCRKGHGIALFVDTSKRLYAVYADTVAYHWIKANPFGHGLWHVLTTERYLHSDDIARAVAEFIPNE